MEKASYGSWDKQRLIQRIKELEKQIPKKTMQNELQKHDFSHYQTRFIALRFAYLGWNYSGLAVQNQFTDPPTVEGKIIDALHLCRLVPSTDPQDFELSRCGRTDKGVSAMNQVISLRVRSKFRSQDEIRDPQNDSKEFDYVRMLNKLLPKDIVFKSVCLRPPDGFDARFSCNLRHYKYFFWAKGLDLEAMRLGAEKFLGEHDFRHFCKVDGSKQITNYNRRVISIEINKVDSGLCVLDLKGSAFLWHQVRCMMAVLFLIGGKHEKPEAVNYLLDVTNTPRRPVYDMAYDVPLVLYDCIYPEGIEWLDPEYQDKSVFPTWWDSRLKHHITSMMIEPHLRMPLKQESGALVDTGSGNPRRSKVYLPLSKRTKMATVEQQNEKYRVRKRKAEGEGSGSN